MSDPLLAARSVSKTYTLWGRPSDRLFAPALQTAAQAFEKLPLGRWMADKAHRMGRPFVALHPLSLEVKAGESLGIIGRNGSGKSTFLQILAGTLTPSSGHVECQGRLAALLELGSGFNPEFTGRENVRLQASIYGVSAADMASHFEEVASFAEIGEFIDQPVKTYSSGMLVRLAFAVQIVLQPDVLVVDEALAVGDIFFQAKCAAYFRKRLAEGMSLIFVSHDLVSVRALCPKAIVLHQGVERFRGDSKEAVGVYHELHASEVRHGLAKPSESTPEAARRNWQTADETGTREVEFTACDILDASGSLRREFAEGEDIRIRLYFRAKSPVPLLHGAFQIVDRHRRVLYGLSTLHADVRPLSLGGGESSVLKINIPGRLGPGEYLLDVALGWGDRGDGAFQHQCHRIGGIAALTISRLAVKPRFLGPVDLAAIIHWSGTE